jgi:PAS domain S-box-containing protein
MNKEFTPRILLIDDLRDNLLTLEMSLRTLAAEIVSVTSGREALIKVQQQDFSLIIIDVQMPEMDGFETAENIRLGRRNQHTPIIFLTAVYNDQQSISQGYRTGAIDYITKPFNREILLSKTRNFLEIDRMKYELRESKKLFHDILQDQTDLICRTDANFKVLFANRALLITLTSTFEMLQGQDIMQWIDEHDLIRWKTLVSSLSPTHDVTRLNHSLKISALRHMPVTSVIRVLYNSNYELTGYQVVMRDITAEVKSSEDLLRLRRHADEQLAAKASFMAAIGKSAAESTNVLIREIDRLMPLQDEGIQRQAEHVAYLAEELQQMLEQFYLLNNLEASQAPPQLCWFNPQQLAEEVIAKVHATRDWKYGVRAEMTDAEPQDAELKGNKSAIGELLFHLLMTTCFFTHSGAIHVSLQSIKTEKNSLKLAFSIQSAQSQIPADVAHQILDGNKSGLKESIHLPARVLLHIGFAKVLAEKLQAQMIFNEKMEGQALFGFRLSLERKIPKKKESSIDFKILVVEDNMLNQKVVATTLKRNGYLFELADNGQMAVEMVKASHFDFIIMDIQMPVVDGYEATRKIRQWEQGDKNRRPAIILALTANATREDQEKCREVGMDGYMTKPFKMNELEEIIQNFEM